ncbi:MAG: phage holin family protein [Betaproteobacteria bacterium]|nr:phage holin family protein [Betaproteobacteria bacterium]MDE2309936.1 phage holin family protein [Betaproteobacteria bacterium]
MPEASSGLMGSLKRLLSTLTSIASTRLELLSNELQEERLHLTQMLFFTLIALFCFGMGLLLFTAFIVVLFWDDHRLAVLGVLCTIFFALGTLLAVLLRSKAQAKSKLFSASLAELARDREQLETGHE